MSKNDIDKLDQALAKLHRAVARQRSVKYCLRLWSEFVRLRDGGRCVLCDSLDDVQAHHIARKTLFSVARYDTGNGITLCAECHSEPHEVFNGRPDLSLPMDAEEGEQIETMMELYGVLAVDAEERGFQRDDYYFLSDDVLAAFKRFQSISPNLAFPGARVQQAYLIWRQTPRSTLNALMGALGVTLSDDFIQLSPMTLIQAPRV